MSSNLQVQYSTLEASAQKADATAEAFAQQLAALQATVTAMIWQGQSGSAFQDYFETMKQQLMPVQQTLHQLAQQIRRGQQPAGERPGRRPGIPRLAQFPVRRRVVLGSAPVPRQLHQSHG